MPGSLTVGSLLEGYEAVAQEPQVPLDPTARQLQFRLDEDSLIGPDGTVISTLTVVKDTAIHLAATAALDTSFPLNQVPKYAYTLHRQTCSHDIPGTSLMPSMEASTGRSL